MELLKSKQISPDDLQSFNYDLFLLASGYEQRSIYLAQNFHINANTKIALAFQERTKDYSRKSNDKFLIDNGFHLILSSGDQTSTIDPILDEVLKNSEKDHLYILIDYSSMTKVWYSELINYLISKTDTCDYITVHFSYTPAIYNEPKKAGNIKFNNPVSFPGKKKPETGKPTALVIGLGLDHQSAEYIWKTVKPELTVLLYADPTHDVQYVEKVFKFNQFLLDNTEVRNLINYPLNDLEKTDEIITNLFLGLRIRYNLVVAPLGPKVLALLILLMASRYPDINVLRVSSGANALPFDRIPFSNPLIYSAEFVSDEIDQ